MLIQHRWQLISGAENIADFSPSVQQINPPWQLENTFSPANESRPLSYFPFFTIMINWWLTLDVFYAVLGGWICLLSMLGCLSTITDQGQGVFDASEQIFHHSPWFPCLCQGEWRLNQNISLFPRFHRAKTRIRRGGSSKKRVGSVKCSIHTEDSTGWSILSAITLTLIDTSKQGRWLLFCTVTYLLSVTPLRLLFFNSIFFISKNQKPPSLRMNYLGEHGDCWAWEVSQSRTCYLL